MLPNRLSPPAGGLEGPSLPSSHSHSPPVFAKHTNHQSHAAAGLAPADSPFFPPEAVIRRVHSEGVVLLGGGRALLMQVAHPRVAAGVAEHSSFRDGKRK